MLPKDVHLDGMGANTWLPAVGGRGELEIPDDTARRRECLDAIARLEERGFVVSCREEGGRQFVRGHPSTVTWQFDLKPGEDEQRARERIAGALTPLLTAEQGYAWFDASGQRGENGTSGVRVEAFWTTDEDAERAIQKVEPWLRNHAAGLGVVNWTKNLMPRMD